MSALFTPVQLRGLTLPNRIMVAPMCQYSADNGEATDWHFTHINSLALSGAAMFCIEATGVEAIGRITHGCLGLWNDATETALAQGGHIDRTAKARSNVPRPPSWISSEVP